MARIEEQRVDGAGDGRTMFVPNMEPYGARLIAAVFRSIGYSAHVVESTDETLAIGLKHTGGGECVPCPVTVGGLLKAMQDRKLPPEKVIFFMPTACGPCRFGQYAKLDSMIFESQGWGDIQILSPSAENAYEGMAVDARKRLWHAIVVSDVLRKLAQKTRPYEKVKGETDACIEEWLCKLEKAFAGTDVDEFGVVLAGAVDAISSVNKRNEKRPLVGVVGEIYVRCDTFINHDLCRRIEELGGEAWLAPISEWILYTNYLRGMIIKEQSNGIKAILEKVQLWLETNFFFEKIEHKYQQIAQPVLYDRHEHPIKKVMEEGCKYLPWQFEGEAVLTLGRAALFVKHDGAKAIVNASPMFCMPGTITTSIFPRLEKELGVPIVCNFYDGSGDPGKSLVPVMHYLCESMAAVSG